MEPQAAVAPTIVLSANSCRNLAHFRKHLLRDLGAAGFRIVALAPLDGSADILRERGVAVHSVPIVRSSLNPIADLRLLAVYRQLLREIRPSAYCGFTIKANVYGGLAARLLGIPFISNVTGLGTVFLRQGWLWRVSASLYRLAFGRAHTVFFHNAADRDAFVDAGIVRPEQAKVIPGSGVDLNHFQPAPTSETDPPALLFVGRLIRDKGVREFVEAARVVRASHPEVRFLLLGDLDPANRTSISTEELRAWVDEGSVEHHAERADVRPLMQAATAVVLPSYREGMSRALLEAAALGKPLVGTDVPGVRELITEGVTGTLCEPANATSLAAALQRMVKLPEEARAKLGANARARVEADFDERLVSEAYLQALHELNVLPAASP